VDVPILGRLREGEYAKEDLLGILQDLCRRGDLRIRFGERFQGLERNGGVFSVRSTSGVTLSRFVILAMGRRGSPRKLGAPGEELPKVMYQLADAESYEQQNILIVGGGDSAVEAALGLVRQRGNRVTLSYRREKLVRIKKKNEERITELLAKRRIEPAFGTEVELIATSSVRLKAPDGVRSCPTTTCSSSPVASPRTSSCARWASASAGTPRRTKRALLRRPPEPRARGVEPGRPRGGRPVAVATA